MAALFQAVLMRLALCGLAASLVLLLLRSRLVRDAFARQLSAWRSLTVFGRVAVCSFLLIGILIGGDKTNNVPPNMNAPLPQMMAVGGSFQTGFTGLTGLSGVWPHTPSYLNPVNLVNPVQTTLVQNGFAEGKSANWNIRGAWKDSFWLPFEDGWVFPWGTNHLSGVEVVSYGQVWQTPFDANAVASLGVPVEIVPRLSSFGYELTPSNSYSFVWTDVAINRDTNNLVTATLELFRDGGVCVTTNGVSTHHPRVLPFPHNGFGQDVEWVAANFTNAAEIAAAGGYAAWVDEQVGEGLTNGLYKLIINVAEDPPETTLVSVGDCSVAITNAGEYVFLLEKGRLYLLSVFPREATNFVYSVCDDIVSENPEPLRTRGALNSPKYTVRMVAVSRPSSFEILEPTVENDGYSYYSPQLSIVPEDVLDPSFPILLSAIVLDLPFGKDASYLWTGEGISETGPNFFWSGEDDVDSISVEATYADAVLEGMICIERYVAQSDISLSGGGIIITEDSYTNEPGVVVSASSTTSRLRLSWALAESGVLCLDSSCPAAIIVSENTGNGTIVPITLPHTWCCNADDEGEKECVVSLVDLSAAGNIGSLTFTFTPDQDVSSISRSVDLNVAKLRVEACADWPSNKVRHVFGPRERFSIAMSLPMQVEVEGGSYASVNGSVVTAPDRPGEFMVTVSRGELSHQMTFIVIAPQSLVGGNPREWNNFEWTIMQVPPFAEGEAGVAMHIDTWVQPSYVSFRHIRMYEGFASTRNRTGWYEDYTMFPESYLEHNAQAGAGEASLSGSTGVTDSNNLTENGDCVAAWIGSSPQCQEGSYELAIPLFWYADGGGYTNSLPVNLQTVRVFSNGTMRVSKNGVTWERALDGLSHQVSE